MIQTIRKGNDKHKNQTTSQNGHQNSFDDCDNFNVEKISKYNTEGSNNESTNNNNSIQTPTSESDGNIQLDAVFSNKSKASDNGTESEEKNNAPLWGEESSQHVTASHSSHRHTQNEIAEKIIGNEDVQIKNKVLQLMLNKIKAASASTISIASVLELIYKQNEIVRAYIGDKLTQRENRKVRDLFVTIVHCHNIEVVKTKPQLLVRWIKPTETHDKPKSET